MNKESVKVSRVAKQLEIDHDDIMALLDAGEYIDLRVLGVYKISKKTLNHLSYLYGTIGSDKPEGKQLYADNRNDYEYVGYFGSAAKNLRFMPRDKVLDLLAYYYDHDLAKRAVSHYDMHMYNVLHDSGASQKLLSLLSTKIYTLYTDDKTYPYMSKEETMNKINELVDKGVSYKFSLE